MAISSLVGLSRLMPTPLVLTSWASSTALILYDSGARVNRIQAIIGCHVLAALTGLVTARGCHAAPWGIGLAVGLALFAALVVDVLHPPAIANAAIVFTSPAPAGTFLLTATMGALVLSLVAVGTRRLDAILR